jgi:starch-binding outer membrane protein, SusD/RagB family
LEPAEIFFQDGNTDGTYDDDNSEVIFAFRWSANEAYNTSLGLLGQGESYSTEVAGNSLNVAFWKKSSKYGYNKTSSFYGGTSGKHQTTRYCTDILHPEMPGFDKRYLAFYRNVITAEVKEETSDGGYVNIGDTIEYFPGVEDGEAYANGKVFHKSDILARNPYAYIFTPSMYDNGTLVNGEYSWIPLWKYFESYNMTGHNGHRDLFYMRLAGAYLLSAEAHLEAGDATTAAERYTAVRARAIDLSKSPTGVDPDARTASDITIDDILDERARELAGEYHRWFDLKRTKTLYERTIKYNLRASQAGNLAADNTGKYYLRPIPQTEIDCSGISQNPGY